MATTRTDVHRPGAIVPAHYRQVLSYHLATQIDGWPLPPWNVDRVLELKATVKFASTGGLGKCSVCGANFIYGDVWVHEPTGEHIHLGHDCADKYNLLADWSELGLEKGRMKAAAAAAITKKLNAERRQATLDAHPGLEAALETNH